MNRYVLNVPVRSWVPQWVAMGVMFLILLTVLMINGAYLGSSIDVSGALGTTREEVLMAYYACSVGMVVANPLVRKVRQILTSKSLLLLDMGLQVVLGLICAETRHIEITILCSFLIGVLKTFLLLEFIILMTPFFSPGNVRSECYSWFYPIVFGGGQLSVPLTAWLANNYHWQYAYYFVTVLLLVTMACVTVFFRDAQKPQTVYLKEIDYRGFFLLSSAYLMIVYVCTYGKNADWFANRYITLFTVLGVVTLVLFAINQRYATKTYISFHPFRHINSVIGYLFTFFTIFLNSDTTLVNSYVQNILNVDNVHANLLGLFTIPGYAIAGVVAFWWFRWQRWRFRYLISAAMGLFACYFATMYWGIGPDSRYEALFLPMVIKGVAMMLCVISFGVYTAEKLEPRYLVSNTFFLISVRSLMTPVFASAFYNNYLYQMQQRCMGKLVEHLTLTEPTAAGRYAQLLQGGLGQGGDYQQAVQLASTNLYGLLQTQGLLLCLKIIFGYLLLAAVVLAVAASLIPFHHTVRVPVVKAGTDMA